MKVILFDKNHNGVTLTVDKSKNGVTHLKTRYRGQDIHFDIETDRLIRALQGGGSNEPCNICHGDGGWVDLHGQWEICNKCEGWG